jgi:hypothetical protein
MSIVYGFDNEKRKLANALCKVRLLFLFNVELMTVCHFPRPYAGSIFFQFSLCLIKENNDCCLRSAGGEVRKNSELASPSLLKRGHTPTPNFKPTFQDPLVGRVSEEYSLVENFGKLSLFREMRLENSKLEVKMAVAEQC